MMHRWPLLLGIALASAAIFAGMQAGADHIEQWHLAARWTALAGLPLFLIAYSASSLGRLAPGSTTRTIWRDRRWWGLGFAASHTIHLYALVTFLQLGTQPRTLVSLIPGGLGYLLLFAMVLTSNNAAMRALGKNWKRLHTVGIHYLWLIFTLSFAKRLMGPGMTPEAKFAFALLLAAAGLRIAVWLKGRTRSAVPA
jgi:DMSO/TMAO reductase YedYZ heme-binding membrane subunit